MILASRSKISQKAWTATPFEVELVFFLLFLWHGLQSTAEAVVVSIIMTLIDIDCKPLPHSAGAGLGQSDKKEQFFNTLPDTPSPLTGRYNVRV